MTLCGIIFLSIYISRDISRQKGEKMKKTLEQELAERLVNIYMEKNVDAMTDVEKSIRQELEAREYFPKDRVYDRTDFFSKRIKKIEQSCERNEDDVDGKGRLLVPRPYMNLKKYLIFFLYLVRYFVVFYG